MKAIDAGIVCTTPKIFYNFNCRLYLKGVIDEFSKSSNSMNSRFFHWVRDSEADRSLLDRLLDWIYIYYMMGVGGVGAISYLSQRSKRAGWPGWKSIIIALQPLFSHDLFLQSRLAAAIRDFHELTANYAAHIIGHKTFIHGVAMSLFGMRLASNNIYIYHVKCFCFFK